MLSVQVGYPSIEEEVEIVTRTTQGALPTVEPVVSVEELLAAQRALRHLPTNPDVVAYAVRLASATRPGPGGAEATRWLRWGAGPRASQYLAVGARTHAALRGRLVPEASDVRAVAHGVLSHRVLLNFEAEAAGVTAVDVVNQILEQVRA